MPYVVSFIKPLEANDTEQYINDCCIGGDLVLNRLLPVIEDRYDDLLANQEDWGWFAWFEQSGVKLAVDIYTNNPSEGEFQIHLTSRKPRLLLGAKIQDTPELEVLRELIVERLSAWPVTRLEVERVNEKYLPS